MTDLSARGLVIIALLAVGCSPGAETADERDGSAEMAAAGHEHELSATDGPGFTADDAGFMQMMIVHHAQAVTMSELAEQHAESQMVLDLAEKIEISQVDEIAFMEDWLEARDQPVANEEQRRTIHMPGMLTPEQTAELGAARDAEFDRLFLTFMIQHHLGAVDMVDDLFANPAAAQDPDIFRFVTDVGADQLDEIGVMETMLDRLDTNSRSESR